MVPSESKILSESDRKCEVRAFEDGKRGVRGLIDAGITQIPNMFLHNDSDLESPSMSQASIPVIDLHGLTDQNPATRFQVVSQIRNASQKCGFFQIVNHGIPETVLDRMIEGVRMFHEQNDDQKQQYYTRDPKRKVQFNSNFDLLTATSACWVDTVYVIMAPDPPKPEDLPHVCREIMMEFSDGMKNLGHSLFELLSESLGLNTNHLNNMGCDEGLFILNHYYPPCPEPEKTLGLRGHTDSGFLTILLQDQIGGLQFLHENHWIDVPCLPGALIVNIADLLQLISNDKVKSVYHRVLAKSTGPRISVASFFRTHLNQEDSEQKVYGPIPELLSEESPPLYRGATIKETLSLRFSDGLGLGRTSRLLSHYRFIKGL